MNATLSAAPVVKKSFFEQDFDKFYDSVEKEIAFHTKWANGTGYFDHAVKADLGLQPGDVAVSRDITTNRRIVIVGTEFGNVVVFERYTPGNGRFILVCNMNRTLASLMGTTGALTQDHVNRLIGMGGQTNVGKQLNKLLS